MACVLACSLHHGQRFEMKIASIKVSNSKKEREIHIRFQRDKKGEGQPCDACRGEKEPLCVQYCIPGAINYR